MVPQPRPGDGSIPAVPGAGGGPGSVPAVPGGSGTSADHRERSRWPRRGPGRGTGRVEETSAGGLVLDRRSPEASVVLIGRLDRHGRLMWSLPKGHLEQGETEQDAAVREVAEETGIHGRIVAPMGSIDFWFTADGRRIHKTVHHFLLLAESGELSDEDIEVTEVAWVPLQEASGWLAYATERALIARVPNVLASTA